MAEYYEEQFDCLQPYPEGEELFVFGDDRGHMIFWSDGGCQCWINGASVKESVFNQWLLLKEEIKSTLNSNTELDISALSIALFISLNLALLLTHLAG